jgi:hypothetical protein
MGLMALEREGLDEAAAVLKGIQEEVGDRPKPKIPHVAAVTDDVEGLEASGWLCVVAALTLWGPRTQADAAALASYVAEAEGGDQKELTEVLTPVVERWQALDVIDDQGRLTDLGWWGLSEAFVQAWS